MSPGMAVRDACIQGWLCVMSPGMAARDACIQGWRLLTAPHRLTQEHSSWGWPASWSALPGMLGSRKLGLGQHVAWRAGHGQRQVDGSRASCAAVYCLPHCITSCPSQHHASPGPCRCAGTSGSSCNSCPAGQHSLPGGSCQACDEWTVATPGEAGNRAAAVVVAVGRVWAGWLWAGCGQGGCVPG